MKDDVKDFVFENKLIRYADAKKIMKDLYEGVTAVLGAHEDDKPFLMEYRNMAQLELVEAHNSLMDKLKKS